VVPVLLERQATTLLLSSSRDTATQFAQWTDAADASP
jgi:hypothetical protein